ncbi:MAG: peptidogalycan biosysnthesis protein, partial [Rhodobacteraceae bacterium]|nr:peptidogalycan biosysnthesis protein [Paracoccaceae bacterium]
ALNFIGLDKLFGRYLGCTEYQDFLHFELCYYQAMDYAIQHGLKYVEAGAGGHHKLARGYLPFKTHSLHWIGHRGFHQALENFLKKEEKLVVEEIEQLILSGPFKKEY